MSMISSLQGFFAQRRAHAVVASLSALVLTGCFGTSPRRVSYDTEEFDSTTTHTRTFPATEAQTCEAARRALLSQGYLISAANADLVTGRKNFQPLNEVHVEVEFRVVCAREAVADKGRPQRRSTIVFVSALQDRYSLKKTNNSASVGVGVIGSLSLPFSASDDAMVKVASETLTDGRFYDRFFVLLDQYLAADANGFGPDPEPPAAAAAPAPAPAPATASATGSPTANPTAPAPTPAAASAPVPPPPAPAAPAPAVPAPVVVPAASPETNSPIPATSSRG